MSSLSFENLKVMAQAFVGQLLRFEFKDAISRFDEQMKTVLNEDALRESWLKAIGEAGSLLNLEVKGTSEIENYKIIIIRCHFQMAIIDVNVVFNEEGQISGLNLIPTQTEYHPPEYVNESAFHEIDVTIGEGKWALPGTLTVPEGSGPFPGIIMVHGSGPNDKDETIGPNKPFRDLSWGLASKGIAVLRYDKRTFVHAKELTPDLVQKITVKEEVIDDAILAIQLMRQMEKIDPKRIFLLGHSLGATVAPRIGKKDQALAGLIIMAGITRSLEDTILDQYTYLYSLSGTMTDVQKAELEALKEKVDRVKDPELSDDTPSRDLPLGVPVAYWKDLRDNDPSDAVKSLSMPILILQGERDYQVLQTDDFEGWKKALNNRKNATFKIFKGLNHLFIAGEGKSTPQEYLVEGHVDVDVIDFMVSWIENV
ncbi:MAG: alpha/beta fold hydrolase [Methanobacterium sp.]